MWRFTSSGKGRIQGRRPPAFMGLRREKEGGRKTSNIQRRNSSPFASPSYERRSASSVVKGKIANAKMLDKRPPFL